MQPYIKSPQDIHAEKELRRIADEVRALKTDWPAILALYQRELDKKPTGLIWRGLMDMRIQLLILMAEDSADIQLAKDAFAEYVTGLGESGQSLMKQYDHFFPADEVILAKSKQQREGLMLRYAPAEIPQLSSEQQQLYKETWKTDLDNSLALAGKEEKLLLVNFTGSDWCMPCQHLKQKVLSQASFIDTWKGDFIFVEVDLPRDEKKLSKEQALLNRDYANRYHIENYPTLLIMNKHGYVLGGFHGSQNPENIKYLLGRGRDFAKEAIIDETQSPIEQARAIQALYHQVPEQLRQHNNSVMMEKIISLDPQDSLGLGKEEKQRALIAEQKTALHRHIAEQYPHDIEAALAYLEQYLKEDAENRLAETRREALNMQLRIYSILVDSEEAIQNACEKLLAQLPSLPEGMRSDMEERIASQLQIDSRRVLNRARYDRDALNEHQKIARD